MLLKQTFLQKIIAPYVDYVSIENSHMSKKIMQILADETGGKSYKAHKYGLDHDERPTIDYGEDSIIWKKTAETEHIRHYVDLEKKSKQVAKTGDQLLT